MGFDFIVIMPLLPSHSGFSFVFLWMWGIFFGEFQCLPLDDCSAVSCDSGALTRGSEHMSFYSAILNQSYVSGTLQYSLLWSFRKELAGFICAIGVPYHIWLDFREQSQLYISRLGRRAMVKKMWHHMYYRRDRKRWRSEIASGPGVIPVLSYHLLESKTHLQLVI